MHARQARRARRQEQHVALAQQVLGAHHVENGARVDARGDAEADARREIRFDQAGDHVHAGPLRREHQVHADGARHLRQTRDGLFDVVAVRASSGRPTRR